MWPFRDRRGKPVSFDAHSTKQLLFISVDVGRTTFPVDCAPQVNEKEGPGNWPQFKDRGNLQSEHDCRWLDHKTRVQITHLSTDCS